MKLLPKINTEALKRSLLLGGTGLGAGGLGYLTGKNVHENKSVVDHNINITSDTINDEIRRLRKGISGEVDALSDKVKDLTKQLEAQGKPQDSGSFFDKLKSLVKSSSMLKETVNTKAIIKAAYSMDHLVDKTKGEAEAIAPYVTGDTGISDGVKKVYEDSKDRLTKAIKSNDLAPLIKDWKQYNAIREGLGMDVSLLDKLKALIY